MATALREYLARLVRSWWAGVGFLFAILGLVDSLFDLDIPAWTWRTAAAAAVVIAGFRVFDDVRRERDLARAELAALAAAGPDADEPPAFVPRLLEGRLFASSFYPVVESSDRALVLRVGYAVRDGQARLDSQAQQAFEDALARSTLESWLRDETTNRGRAGADHWWRRASPTRSSIVTVRRPPAKAVAGDYEIEAHAVLNLQPEHTPWPTGWLLALATVVVRPQEEAGRAFTYPSLYGAAEALIRALVDEIAPRALARVAPTATPYSLSLLLEASDLPLADVVALDWHGWERAEGMADVSGGQWFAPSEAVALDATARQEHLRQWFASLLADSGYSEHEADLAKLVPLRLPPPPD